MGKGLDELASYFRPLAEKLIDEAISQGLDPVIEDTGRTPAEQRVKLATNVSWTSHSKHLPQPPEGKSEAIDAVPRACMREKYWGWTGKLETSHPHWAKYVAIVQSLGLRSGVSFNDPGHAEYIHPNNHNQVAEAVTST